MPAISQSKLHFDRLFRLRCSTECGPNPVERSSRCISLSCGSGALEQCSDLAQLLPKLVFSSHLRDSLVRLESNSKRLRTRKVYRPASLSRYGPVARRPRTTTLCSRTPV